LLLLLAGDFTCENDLVTFDRGGDVRVAQSDTFHMLLQLIFGIGVTGGQQVDKFLAGFFDKTEQTHNALLGDKPENSSLGQLPEYRSMGLRAVDRRYLSLDRP